MDAVSEQNAVENDAKQELLALIKKLEEIRELPENFINEYFDALRRDVDYTAEKILDGLKSNSNEIVLLNEKRKMMIELLNVSEKKCLDKIDKSLLSEIGLKHQKFLNNVNLGQYSKEPKAGHAFEEYALLKNQLQEETRQICRLLLKQSDFVFTENKTDPAVSEGSFKLI